MTTTTKCRLFLAIFAGSVLCGITAWADPPSQVGRLSLISGSVSFLPGSLNEWTPATLNYPLTAGDHLWTDTGARAEVHVLSAAIRLNSNTEFSFLNLDDQTVQIRLSEGSLNVNLRGVDSGTTFEIDTPNSTVSLGSAGRCRIDVQPEGETTVSVRAGSAEVTAGGDAYDVSAGQFTVISGVDSITYYVTAAAQTDEWDAWCTSRDRREDQLASNLHVSREMIGAEDLNENGTWFVEAGYGPAWAPSHVPAGWAPYRFGHWTWVEPWGWTWIDDTAWGFAPFHYGRWAFLKARWVWSPGAAAPHPVYAPALVVFIGGPGWTPAGGDGIGWFPLGPREAYYPSYLVSASYVQRINVGHVANINARTIETFNPNQVVYVNRNAPQGVTFVPRNVFVQSRPAGGAIIPISAADITRAPLMGMTAKVVPQRESIIAKPIASRAPVPQPQPGLTSGRVYSRVAPPPARVPFAQQQQMLMANPGRPVDPAVLSGIQRRQRPVSTVTIVNPATLTTLKKPPVLRTPPTPAPGGRQKTVTPAPSSQQPAVRQTQGGQQKTVTPAPSSQQPAVRQTQGGQQKTVTPAPSSQQRTTNPASVVKEKPTVTAPPPGKQPAVSTAGGQRGSSAATLITTLKTRTLPDADRRLSEARKVAGIRIDLNAVAGQIAAAKESLASAEKDLGGGNSDQAVQKATAIQKQIDDQMNQLSAAMQAAKQGPQKQ